MEYHIYKRGNGVGGYKYTIAGNEITEWSQSWRFLGLFFEKWEIKYTCRVLDGEALRYTTFNDQTGDGKVNLHYSNGDKKYTFYIERDVGGFVMEVKQKCGKNISIINDGICQF